MRLIIYVSMLSSHCSPLAVKWKGVGTRLGQTVTTAFSWSFEFIFTPLKVSWLDFLSQDHSHEINCHQINSHDFMRVDLVAIDLIIDSIVPGILSMILWELILGHRVGWSLDFILISVENVSTGNMHVGLVAIDLVRIDLVTPSRWLIT